MRYDVYSSLKYRDARNKYPVSVGQKAEKSLRFSLMMITVLANGKLKDLVEYVKKYKNT